LGRIPKTSSIRRQSSTDQAGRAAARGRLSLAMGKTRGALSIRPTRAASRKISSANSAHEQGEELL